MIATRIVRGFLVGIGLGTIGAGGIYSAAKVSDPLILLYRQRAELAALDARKDNLAAEEQRLQTRLAYFSSEDGRRQRMHELGLLLPGERFLRLLPSEPASKPTGSKTEQKAIDRVRAAAKRLGKRVRQAITGRAPKSGPRET